MLDRIRNRIQSMTSDELFVGLVVLFIAALLLSGATFVLFIGALTVGYVNEDSHAQWGTAGDFLGGVLGPVLGFLSFIALLLTIVLQNRELQETRRELMQSREAHQGQLRELRLQASSSALRERRDLTFTMLQRWTSAEMREHRLLAWDYVFDRSRQAAAINIYAFRRESRDTHSHFVEVCHFFSDLHKLLDEQLVDEQLAQHLFGDSIHPWFEFIARLDFTLDSSMQTAYDDEVEVWYRRRVMALKEYISSRHAPAISEDN